MRKRDNWRQGRTLSPSLFLGLLCVSASLLCSYFLWPDQCICWVHGAEMQLLGELPNYLLRLIFYIFRLALLLTSSSKISEKGSDWPAMDQVSTINQSAVARKADLFQQESCFRGWRRPGHEEAWSQKSSHLGQTIFWEQVDHNLFKIPLLGYFPFLFFGYK